MITFIYKTLASIGFNHPLHPAVTHIPMGLILGGCIFAIASQKKPELLATARHCYMLALVFIPLAALTGIMDWQYRLFGKGSSLIIFKMVLAVAISMLVIATLIFSRKEETDRKLILFLFIITALGAVVQGFLGGEILYG